MNKKQKAALLLNFLIFAFTVFATISMMTGFQFLGEVQVFASKKSSAFKFFTVDSNIFAGLVSLYYVIYSLSPAGKKQEKLPAFMYALKLAATSGVTLTMMVTVFFLAPGSSIPFFAYFTNSNFFMHLITPLFCIISFIFFEPADKVPFKMSLTGPVPMLLYACFYIPNIVLHLDNGKVNPTYDWYGFLQGGANTAWIVCPLVLLITWGFSLGLWALNKKIASK